MKSTNPMFHNNAYEQAYALTERPMTVSGTMNKLLLLSFIMILSVAGIYYQFSLGRFDFVQLAMIGGIIIGFISAIVMAFKPTMANVLAPVYAIGQGAAVAAISCMFEAQFPRIVIQAISITFLVVFSMAILYKAGIIRYSETFRSIIAIGTLAIAGFYLISFILMLCHVNVPYFTVNSPITIGVNVAIAIFAALNLITDFAFIEEGANRPLPAHFEWYGAFGLLVTILWLYVEILRLLSRLSSRNN